MLILKTLDIRNENIKTTLPNEVISHIDKINNEEANKLSRFAWSLLIDILSSKFKIDFKQDKILFSKNGKPYLKSKKVFFSISHSSNLVAVAISEMDVGVDIQKIIPNKLCNLLSNRILNKIQYVEYENTKDKIEYLTKIWTQKEAYIKCFDQSLFDIETLKNIDVKKNISTTIIYDSLNNKYFLSICENKGD